jgi:hypothetical protein
MTTHTETHPAASPAQIREAEAFTDLAHQAMRRADDLAAGREEPDHEAFALACACAAALEEQENLGVERGSDWTDHLLDMMRLLGRKGAR